MKSKEKQVMEKLVDCHSNDLIEVYEEQGEKAFRSVAKFMGLKKKDIDSTIKEFKLKEKKVQKQLMINYKKFYKGFERCPICGGEMINYNDVIIKKARDASVLLSCPNCEILIGRYT